MAGFAGGPGPRRQSSSNSETPTGTTSTNNGGPGFPLSMSLISPTTDPGTTASVTIVMSSSTTQTDTSSDSDTGTISSASPTPTSSPTPPIAPAPWFFIHKSQTGTTCEQYQVQWQLPNSSSLNDDVNIHLALYVTSNDGSNLNVTLANQQPIITKTYTWPAITVPPGNYALHGVETDGTYLIPQSYNFSVQAGPNSTCTTTTSSGSSSTGSSGSGSGSGSTVNGTLPISTASKSGTNTAAIAGGTVAGLVGLAIVAVAVYFLCIVPRRSRHGVESGGGSSFGSAFATWTGAGRRSRVRSLSAVSRQGKKDWNGLNSMDSKTPIAPEGGGEMHDYGAQNYANDHGGQNYTNDPTLRVHGHGNGDDPSLYAARESVIRAITASRMDSSSVLGEGEKVVMHDVGHTQVHGYDAAHMNGLDLRYADTDSAAGHDVPGMDSTSVPFHEPAHRNTHNNSNNNISNNMNGTSIPSMPSSNSHSKSQSVRSSFDIPHDPFATPSITPTPPCANESDSSCTSGNANGTGNKNGINSNSSVGKDNGNNGSCNANLNNIGTNSRRASRTPRKPVPAYDPTQEELEAMTTHAAQAAQALQGLQTAQRMRSDSRESVGRTSSMTGTTMTGIGTGTTSYPPYQQYEPTSPLSTSPSSQSHSYFRDSYTLPPSSPTHAHSHTASHPNPNPHAPFAEAMLHSLKTKSSGQFEGQTVHYLIPDMPAVRVDDD